ncbi:MAG: hypothetical protein DCC51_12575 [Anaerolineae bacterium]|nr:MAG: hypothetical protein DCC51_12575 [Anaerolineae bacterium]
MDVQTVGRRDEAGDVGYLLGRGIRAQNGGIDRDVRRLGCLDQRLIIELPVKARAVGVEQDSPEAP